MSHGFNEIKNKDYFKYFNKIRLNNINRLRNPQ